MQNPSFTFTRAITRSPAKSVINGLRATDIGMPDFAQMQRDHAHYVETLKLAGLEVTELPALPDFPDAQFVEDTALCLPEMAILMRPGAPSRMGEVAEIAPHLAQHYDLYKIETGYIEAGDILTTNTEILVGLSDRTNRAGIAALQFIVQNSNYTLRIVETPSGVLHFKTDCSLLDGETILSTKRLADSGCFTGYNVIYTADGEEAAANAIRVNDKVLMAKGFPRTHAILQKAGYDVVEINNSECAKIDGGMSCLSLRF
ncbi:MAG: arginine deiminase family protein [Rhodobacteraceae bacterium]|nr:arginine deiminase family protein [Paracoccaceae bacterium]